MKAWHSLIIGWWAANPDRHKWGRNRFGTLWTALPPDDAESALHTALIRHARKNRGFPFDTGLYGRVKWELLKTLKRHRRQHRTGVSMNHLESPLPPEDIPLERLTQEDRQLLLSAWGIGEPRPMISRNMRRRVRQLEVVLARP